MERIDKIIASQGVYSRSEVKKLIQQKKIKVNGEIITSSNIKIDTANAKILIDNEDLTIKEHIYLMLNKPEGYVSATKDGKDKTVLDLVPDEYKSRGVFPAGRLDKNTTGLMIITDDGQMAHNILAPKKHISKKYEVTIDIPVTEEMRNGFKDGVDLIDGKCKSSDMVITGQYTAEVILTEGRYHQIKRMFGCYGAKVTKLHRTQMGKLELPKDLAPGKTRELTPEELEKLCQIR